MANQRLYRFWGDLTTALRTGEPQNETSSGGDNQSLHRPLRRSPNASRGFLSANDRVIATAQTSPSRSSPYGQTTSPPSTSAPHKAISSPRSLSPTPHARQRTGFDLPEVGPIFEDYVVDNGLSGRVQFHPGSFWDAPIPNADVVMMGHILHDWNLNQKKLLIRKAYDALPTGGALVVYESIIDDDRSKNAFGLMMSLNMLIETPGGFDYTGADCTGWMHEAGFKETRVEHLVGPDSMVIGIK